MALTGDYLDKTGILHSGVYARITQVNINTLTKEGGVELAIFSEKGDDTPIDTVFYRIVNKRKEKMPPSYIHYDDVYSLDHLDLVNPIMQAYTMIKLKPEWASYKDA